MLLHLRRSGKSANQSTARFCQRLLFITMLYFACLLRNYKNLED